MSSPPKTTNDLGAVADALRSHDRFLLVTHENPDGDALGSIVAAKLALDRLGKDSVMYVGGGGELPLEFQFMDLSDLRRELPPDADPLQRGLGSVFLSLCSAPGLFMGSSRMVVPTFGFIAWCCRCWLVFF